MKNLFLLALLAQTLVLNGCYAPLIEGAQQGYDSARRESLEETAGSRNATDQFALGDSYCCQGAGPLHDLSVYDNVKATLWYCRAARQGYAPAQLRLARLYSGHAIRGLHIMLRASELVGTSDVNLSVALVWARLAAAKGEEDAVELRDEITKLATADERHRADALAKAWRTAPCLWRDVIPEAAKPTDKAQTGK